MTAALYIHIPFCRHKCIYCDFYSLTNLEQIDNFVSALRTEIGWWAKDSFSCSLTFSTLYFGGGTPSLLTPQHMSILLNDLFVSFKFADTVEISMEANPGALFVQNLSEYRQVGINRLTLGVQSFRDDDLEFLTRIHSAQEAESAMKAARRAGFDNLGIDLIFGLPGQSLQSWQQSLHRAVDFAPEHISTYGLTYEENTPLWHKAEKGAFLKCEEELERQMFLTAIDVLQNSGYEQYEISNFAIPGFRSQHNQKYWDGSPFLSLGPSAHSFDGHRRWWNVRNLKAYLEIVPQRTPIEDQEVLTPLEKSEEFIMLGLRRKEGLAGSDVKNLIGLSMSEIKHLLEDKIGGVDSVEGFAESLGDYLVTFHDGRIALTRQGLLVYNLMCENIFSLVNNELKGA